MIELFIRNLLRADAEIKTLIGTDANGYAKVYSVKALQETDATYITISLVSKARRAMGVNQYRLQFSTFAKSYGQAKNIANAIEKKVKTIEGLSQVFAAYPENQIDLYEEDTKLYHIPIDITFYRLEEADFA